MTDYVPSRFTTSVAALLAGRTVRDMRRQARLDLIEAEGGDGRWLRVPRAAVERLRGAVVSNDDYLSALARLEPDRQRENARNRARREG